MALVHVLLSAAIAILLWVALLGWRNRLLAAAAWRNALRRPRQSLMVVAGLLVGTAIVGGALVTGDSMGYAIVEATYHAFQEIDETVYVEGYHFFPQTVGAALANDSRLAEVTDGVGANILWDVAVTNERSELYEPSMRLVGFDPHADRPFGTFQHGKQRFTGEDLGPFDAVVGDEAARALDARVGDPLTVRYALPIDPLLPRFHNYTGQISASAGGPLPSPFPSYVEPAPWTQTFDVGKGAVRLSVVLGWNPLEGGIPQDLDVDLTSPSGRVVANANGTLQAPDVPAFLNVTGSLARPLEFGPWTLRVHAKGGAQTHFNGTLVELDPVYDLREFENRTADLQRQFPQFDPSQVPEPDRRNATFTVRHLAQRGKGPDFALPHAYNVFVRMDTLQALLERTGEVNFVKISNRGGVEEGPRTAPTVYVVAWERLNATKPLFPEQPAIQALVVGNDKVFWLDQAERVGELFSTFLTFLASFSIITGLMLIINIFTMLAEERKTELGISRAVGLRRRHLSRLFTMEGALYALPAAVLGTFAGLGLARGLIWGFNVFGDAQLFPPIPYRFDASRLLLAFSIGILLTLGTVYIGARRISRLNVVRAIRNLDEPERARGRTPLAWGLALAALGAAGTLGGFLLPSFPLQVAAPTLLAVGFALLLRRRHSRQTAYPLVALLLAAYLTTTIFLKKEYASSLADNIFDPIRSILITLCLVLLVVYNEAPSKALGRLLRLLRPFRPVATVAVSYPLHKKFRTGLTLAMFAVILLMVTLFSIFGNLFAPDPEKESGGYDVQATANANLPDLDALASDPRVQRYEVVPYFLQIGGTLVQVENGTTGQFGPPLDHVYGIDAGFAEHNQFRLLRRDPLYPTDADAYRALLADRSLVIVGYTYSTDERGNDDVHHLGDALQLDARGGTRTLRIIGIQEQAHFKGIFLGQAHLKSLYSNWDTLFLIRLHADVDADVFAQELEARHRDVGLNAAGLHSEVLRETESFRQIFTLIQVFLGLGLIVGVLSLGIITARSIIERRQEIGMLRAVGYRRRLVRRAFLLETLATVALGVLIGALVAVVVSFGLWTALLYEFEIPYRLPWTDLATIALIAFATTTLATLAPIIRASRIPPADALRYIE